MVGLSWTEKDDLEFMNSRLPEFEILHSSSKARKKNGNKKAFFKGVYDDYEERFPGRMERWELKGVRAGTSPNVLKEKRLSVSII